MNTQTIKTKPAGNNSVRLFARKSLACVTAALALFAGAANSQAASDAWDGSVDGVWATSANWLTDPATVPGTGEIATFNGAGNGNTTIDLGAGVTISNVLFDTASAAAYTIGSGGVGSQTLSFDNAGLLSLSPTVASSQVFNANLSLATNAAASMTISNGSSALLTVGGGILGNVVSGNGVLTVTGSGNTLFNGPVTKPGAGSLALFKRGAGRLTLSTNSVWSGTGAASGGFSGPLIAQEGTLLLTGGTNNGGSEVVIGGVVANGGAGQNARIHVVNDARLAVTTWLSVGRGNGVGGVSSDLVASNSAVITTANVSAGFNGGNTANLPKGSITLNDNSSLTANGNLYVGESSGSDMTLTVNGSAAVTNVNAAGIRVSSSGKGTLVINGGTVVTEGDMIMNFNTSGETNGSKMILNGGNLHVAGSLPASTAERWLIVKRTGNANTDLIISNGTVHLNNQTDLRFSTQDGNATGSNTVSIYNGAIVGYSDRATTVGGNVQIDMQRNGGAATVNTFNLNGGVVTVRDVISGVASGTRVFNFNGGTLRPNASTTTFFNLGLGSAYANVRNGGAIIDTDGKDITIAQFLQHSDIIGDNATDGGLTKLGAGTLTLSGGYNYTGPTVIGGGVVSINSGAASGTPGSLSVSNGTLNLDVIGGTPLPVANLTLNNNGNVTLNYGGLAGNPTAAAINATGNLTAPGTSVTLAVSGVGFQPGQFTLIDYSGTGPANLANFLLTLPPGVVATLSNNTASTSIDLVITTAPQNLTWYGTNANWDVNTTFNFNTATLKYLEYGTPPNTVGDAVLFDDTLFNDSINPQFTNVNLTTAISSFPITVDSTLPYSFSGPGQLVSVASIVKSNTGSLLLMTSNSFTGGTRVYGGSVVITNDNALGANASVLTLAGGGLQVDANATNTTRAISVTAASTLGVAASSTYQVGGVVSGSGALSKIDNGTLNLTGNNTFTGSTIIKSGIVGVRGGVFGLNTADVQISPESSDTGTLEVSGGTLNANRVIIGGNSANAGSPGAGVVNQTGGTINSRQWFSVGSGVNGGGSGSGTYNFSGGTLNVQIQRMEVGNFTATDGTVNMSGSAVLNIWSNNFLSLGANNDATSGTFNQNGGTVTLYSNGGVTAGGTGTLFIGQAGTLSGTFTYNLNGGTLVVPSIQGNTANTATRVFNFNGGTLRASIANANYITGLSSVNVLAGGALIDTTNNNITISAALLAGSPSGGLTKLGSGTLNLTAANTYTGTSAVSAGTLFVTPAHQVASQPVTVASNAAFGVLVNTTGAAQVGNVTLGDTATARTTLSFLLNTGSNPTSPVLQCGTLTLNGTNTFRLSGTVTAGIIPLVQYTGAIAGSGTINSAVVLPQGQTGVVSNHVAGSTLYAIVSGVPGIVWTGTNSVAASSNVWNLNTITNWLAAGVPTTYQETTPPGDPVTFNDIGSGVVLLSNTASPASVTISNISKSYTFSGTGRISGTAGVVKQGAGTATMSLAGNDYSGNTTISAGTLRLGSGTTIPEGTTAGGLVVNAAGTLDVNGFSETINGLSGSGIINNASGTGATLTIGNGNGGGTWSGLTTNTGAGTVTFIKVGAGSLTISGTNYLGGTSQFNGTGSTNYLTGSIVGLGTGEFWVQQNAGTNTFIVNGGSLSVNNWFVVGRNATAANGTFILNSGTVSKTGGNNVVVGSLNATGLLEINGGQFLNNGMLWLGENATANATLRLNGGLIQATQVRPNNAVAASFAYFNGGTLQASASSADFIGTATSALIQSGGLILDTQAFGLTNASPLGEDGSSPGGGLKKIGSGTLALTGASTYSGLTIVSNGTLLVDGSISGAATVKSGATLGGIGSIGGVVTVEAGGKLAAGASIGTLTLSASPVLGGSVVAELDRNDGVTFLADLITVSGLPINYGGTLVLSNAGAALVVGDTFKVFDASSYSGSFTLVSQTPLQNVTWNTANLTVNGTISVATASSAPSNTPTNIVFNVTGNTLGLSWPESHRGWTLQTNAVSVAAPASWFAYPGSATETNINITINPSLTNVFFRLVLP